MTLPGVVAPVHWVVLLVAVTGCAQPSATTVHDQYGREVTVVDTGIDPAGGARLSTVGQFNSTGEYRVLATAQGPGTFQTVLPSVFAAAGFVGGMHLLAPAEFNNQTNVSATNSGITAASNPATKVSAAGGEITGGTATGGNATGVSTSAGGGAATAAGGSSTAAGGAGGAGGSSSASPTITNNPVVNSAASSNPMFTPQFNPVVSAAGGAGGTAIGAPVTATGGSAAGGAGGNGTGGSISCQGNCQ
jgi:hypothetical protein